MSTHHREVVVIGGGQAGLAIGHFLAQQGRRFTILEAADAPAAAWRERWDSLRLFTPARFDSLPGKPFPGDPDRYPTRDEVVGYLTDYARDLPVELSSRVRKLRRDDARYRVELDDRTYEADQVVIATGPFQTPRIPALAARLAPDVHQLHSAAYRNPAQIPAGPVLVVGGGNTGYQIAEELATTHEVHLAVGSQQKPLPQRILGRDIFRYLNAPPTPPPRCRPTPLRSRPEPPAYPHDSEFLMTKITPATRHFLRHYGEMLAAMFIGMAASGSRSRQSCERPAPDLRRARPALARAPHGPLVADGHRAQRDVREHARCHAPPPRRVQPRRPRRPTPPAAAERGLALLEPRAAGPPKGSGAPAYVPSGHGSVAHLRMRP